MHHTISIRNLSFFVVLAVMLVSAGSCKHHDNTEEWTTKGNELSAETFDTLRNALMHAIATQGLPGAVDYCNEQALSITSSNAQDGITIKRVAEKYRNPLNAPDSLDMIQWERFRQMKSNGDSLHPIVVNNENSATYYKPILLQQMCSPCHGKPGEEIPELVMARIRSLYPNDKATGFSHGDLRGMWKITFNK